jgi:hypothetical protein
LRGGVPSDHAQRSEHKDEENRRLAAATEHGDEDAPAA